MAIKNATAIQGELLATPAVAPRAKAQAKIWHLRDKSVCVAQLRKHAYRVRISWSARLGLQHPHVFKDADSAEAFAASVRERAIITRGIWMEAFYPGDGWEHGYA